MKIYLDRNVCNCWEAACTTDFTDKYLGKDVEPTACTLLISDEDDRSQITFYIKDKDGSDKELIVNDQNLALAMDSWMDAYKAQEAAK